MRGSPFLRTLLVALALVATAFALHHLPTASPALPQVSELETTSATLDTPYFLTLSHPAESVTLETSGKIFHPSPDAQTLSGSLPLEVGHPTIFLTVAWRDPDDSPRFAKLTLEPPDLPTLSHYFEARGNLSDVWEPHLHAPSHD